MVLFIYGLIWPKKFGATLTTLGEAAPKTLAVAFHARAVGTAKTSEHSMKRHHKNDTPALLLCGDVLNNVKSTSLRK